VPVNSLDVDADQYLTTAIEALSQGDDWQTALSQLPIPVYTTDASGAVTYWNQACVDFAGREPQLGQDRWCVTWELYTTTGERLPHDSCPMAEAIQHLFSVNKVHAIDVVDRFCPDLSVETARYDGKTVPFADGAFDAATLNNVVHHVPVGERVSLLREIRRVVNGPLYIKDHVTTGVLDDLRLATLDAIGNIPFGGMVKARYLSAAEWRSLGAESGWRIGATAVPRAYRSGAYAVLFPNRLETTMRFDPA